MHVSVISQKMEGFTENVQFCNDNEVLKAERFLLENNFPSFNYFRDKNISEIGDLCPMECD